MSMTLTPSSGPMVWSAPDARSFDGAIIPGLVTSARPEDQGQQAYGRMREGHTPRRAGERRDPYSATLQFAVGANDPAKQQAPVVMGPGVRRDDVRENHQLTSRAPAPTRNSRPQRHPC